MASKSQNMYEVKSAGGYVGTAPEHDQAGWSAVGDAAVACSLCSARLAFGLTRSSFGWFRVFRDGKF